MVKKRNPGLPEDEEIARQFKDAADKLAAIMTQADQQGLAVGFDGINKNPNQGNRFEVSGLYVNKRLLV